MSTTWWRPARATVAAASVAAVAVYPLSDAPVVRFTTVACCTAGLLAVACAAALSRAAAAPDERVGWWFFVLAAVVGPPSTLASVLVGVTGHDAISTSLQWYRMALLPVAFLGMPLAWQSARLARGDRSRVLLDTVAFAASVFVLLWVFGFATVFRDTGDLATAHARNVLRVLLIALVLGAALYQILPDVRRVRGPLGVILILIAVALSYSLLIRDLMADGRLTLGHPLVLVPVAIAGMFVGAAVIPGPVRGRAEIDRGPDAILVTELLIAIPLVAAFTAFAYAMRYQRPQLDATLLVALLILVVTVIVRQFLAVRALANLTRELEQRVSERTRQLEESRRSLERMQRLDAVGRLAAGIAHDFNNMLTAIRGFGEMLVDEMPPDAPGIEDARQILVATDRGRELIARLLLLGRKQETPSAAVSLGAEVRANHQLLERLVGEEVKVTVRDAAVELPVRLAAGQLVQVLTNLAVNARQAMPRGGALDIEVERVDLGDDAARRNPEAPAGGYAHIRVRDTGTGMDETTQTLLFEPFFTTKGPGEGTGLGLATVYAIIRQARGFIEVSSRLGGGTTFDVYVPLASGSAAT